MKYKALLLLFFTTIFLLQNSCSKRMVPSDILKSDKSNYDLAAFDYIFVEAIKLKVIGNGGEALRYFEQCLKINPKSDATYYQMAQIVFSMGDIKNGRKYLNKAMELDPYNKWYPVMMAGTYYQTGSIDSAIFFYEKAVKNSPEKEEIQFTLANLYSENKEYEKAVKIFDELDTKYGVNEASTLAAVKNLMSAGKFEQALKKITDLIDLNPEEIAYYGLKAEIYRELNEKDKAIEIYNDLLTKSPDNPETLLSLGDFLLQEKNYDDLTRIVTQIIMNKEITREDKISFFAGLIQNQNFVEKKGEQLQTSLMVLEAAYPGDNIIKILRPELLLGMKNYTSAINRLEELIADDQGNYYAWEKLLLTYLEVRDYKKLQSRGAVCAGLFNRSFLAKMLYATGATENGDYNTALAELDKAKILAGSDNDMLLQVLTVRADIYYRTKDLDKSFETFEEALNIKNDDLTILNNYAYYLAEQDQNLKEAEKMSRKVIESEPSNNTFLDTYAWVLFKKGKLREAIKIMESIINSGKEPDAEWFEHYGYMLKRKKECNKAIESWKKAIELDKSKTDLLKEIENCKE